MSLKLNTLRWSSWRSWWARGRWNFASFFWLHLLDSFWSFGNHRLRSANTWRASAKNTTLTTDASLTFSWKQKYEVTDTDGWSLSSRRVKDIVLDMKEPIQTKPEWLDLPKRDVTVDHRRWSVYGYGLMIKMLCEEGSLLEIPCRW